MRKGISPLIAAVLLIAFTMAIAGIMASWATTFSSGRLSSAQSQAECVGALDIGSLRFENTTINLRIRNTNEQLNLTGMRAVVEYDDPSKNAEYVLINYNITDPLAPAVTTFLTLDTGDTTKPDKIEVIASNCPQHSAVLFFR